MKNINEFKENYTMTLDEFFNTELIGIYDAAVTGLIKKYLF